jgi:hypothetical protein
MASHFSESRELQVPGDDVGFSYRSDEDRRDKLRTAASVGVLQMDKVYHLPGAAVFLKRAVMNLGVSVDLADMLIYPLLPFLISVDGYASSRQFRYPDRRQLLSRTSSVLVSFMRDLWRLTSGNLSASDSSTILSFLRGIHTQVGLPYGAIFQSQLYGPDGFVDHSPFDGIVIKFPVEEDDCLLSDPDLSFASYYVEHMAIRMVDDVPLSSEIHDVVAGEYLCVRKSKGWSFLEDMGYVTVLGIPGQVVHLVGVDAKEAFMSAATPPYREVRVDIDMSESQLRLCGIVLPQDLDSDYGEYHTTPFKRSTDDGWRRYRDWDAVEDSGGGDDSNDRSSNVYDVHTLFSEVELDYG